MSRGLNLRELKNALEATDLIITPKLTEWFLVHGDDELTDEIADLIRNLLTAKPRYRGASFSSSSASGCYRAQVFGFLDALGTSADARLQNIFSDGKWRHLRWQAILLSAGLLTEVEFPLPWPRKRSVGTMDGLGIVPADHPRLRWRGQEFGFELKGMNPNQWNTHKTDDTMKHEHLSQVARYLLSSDLPLFVIVYENKATQEWVEWVIERDDPEVQAYIDEQRKELDELNLFIDREKLPDRIPECAKLSGPHFLKCGFGGKGGICARITTYPKRGTLRYK